VSVRVFAYVTDTCDTTTWKITDVTSDEPADAKNDDNKDPDWAITGAHTVKLRAEKNPNGSARVYTITVQAKDASGNLSDKKTVTVTVPKSQGHGDDNDQGHGDHNSQH